MEVIVGHVDSYTGGRNNFTVSKPSDAPALMRPGNVDTAFNTIVNPFTAVSYTHLTLPTKA